MWASRRCSRGGSVSPLAQGGHRLGDRVERRRLVGRAGTFDAVLPPALGVLVARRGGDRADRVALDRAEPAAPASSSSEPSTSDAPAGRSMKRNGTSRSSAWRSARHSGEKRANG
jgi:hypothetical protein